MPDELIDVDAKWIYIVYILLENIDDLNKFTSFIQISSIKINQIAVFDINWDDLIDKNCLRVLLIYNINLL